MRHNSIEIRPINNPTVASKCSSERKNGLSLTLNQKLEVIKLSEEGMSKTETAWKWDLLNQPAKLWMQKKSSWRSANPVNTQTISTGNSFIADTEKVLAVWIKDQTSHNIPLSQTLI